MNDNDVKILKRLVPQTKFNPVPEGADVRTAAIIDLETTGLDHKTEEIIQLSAMRFTFDRATGQVYEVLDTYTSYEQPSKPIPEEANAVNHITDEMVAGKSINEARVYNILKDVDFVISHNIKFDRPFFELRFTEFPPYKWVCSFRDVPWRHELMGSGSLELLLMKQGLFADQHDAEIDAYALLAVLSKPTLKTGLMPMLKLCEAMNVSQFILYAFGAAIETKDKLKERGYRWDVEHKVWNKYLQKEEAKPEAAWLFDEIYSHRETVIGYKKIDASNRHSVNRDTIKSLKLKSSF